MNFFMVMGNVMDYFIIYVSINGSGKVVVIFKIGSGF